MKPVKRCLIGNFRYFSYIATATDRYHFKKIVKKHSLNKLHLILKIPGIGTMK